MWRVDAEVFQPFSEVRLVDRVTGRLRSFGRLFLIAGFLSYPLLLIILGVVYGGLAFWGLFGVSMCVIWLVLTRTGYARNFEEWDSSLSSKLAAITVGFLGVMGFFLGLLGVTDLRSVPSPSSSVYAEEVTRVLPQA